MGTVEDLIISELKSKLQWAERLFEHIGKTTDYLAEIFANLDECRTKALELVAYLDDNEIEWRAGQVSGELLMMVGKLRDKKTMSDLLGHVDVEALIRANFAYQNRIATLEGNLIDQRQVSNASDDEDEDLYEDQDYTLVGYLTRRTRQSLLRRPVRRSQAISIFLPSHRMHWVDSKIEHSRPLVDRARAEKDFDKEHIALYERA